MIHRRLVATIVGLMLALVPGTLFAQTGTSGIAGVVRDTSGAVLPGVTVEAASPVLIEKVRTVVTDGEGAYRVLDLRPGAYTVTFTLAGFSTIRREGIDLPAAFTATVSVEMRVGAVEETITVSGAAPLVDVQNVTSQRLMSAELLESIPAGRSPQGFTSLTPGIISQGLGNIPGDRAEMNTTVHGSAANESVYMIDGIDTAEVQGAGGSNSVFRISQAYVQEINVTVGGGTAEQPYGGTVTNVIPKEGGNTFSGSVYGEYSGESLAGSNLTQELLDLGFTDNSLSNLVKLWDFSPAIGGRIIRDKLWFFSSHRTAGTIQTRAGMFENLTPRGWAYTPDTSNPAVNKLTDKSYNTRLTWQATPKHKIIIFGDVQPHIGWQRFGTTAPISQEATTYTPYLPNAIFALQWKSPMTNRILVEATGMHNSTNFSQRRHTPETCMCNAPIVGFDIVSAVEATTGTLIRSASSIGAGASDYGWQSNNSFRYRATISYVTGSHATKAGFTLLEGSELFTKEPNGAIAFSLRNGVPTSLAQYAMPIRYENDVHADLGLFVQDQWTMRRLTLTGGVRFDYLDIGAVAQDLAAGEWIPARSFAATNHEPQWKDFSPRIAASYDLFGDGKTALKFTMGRFVQAYGAGVATQNPVVRSVQSVTRTWTDGNANFNPDCDLKNFLANGECGQISNLNFGQANPNATTTDPEVLTTHRNQNWETTVVAQRQLSRGMSVTFGYFRRVYDNFTATDNQLVSPGDYNQYCVTAPVDSRLPGGGGNQLCGLYDVVPALFGRNQSNIRLSSNFGDQVQTYDGFDLTESIRLSSGATVTGGLNWGRTKTNTCFVVDSPGALRFCEVTPPMQPNATFTGFVPLPWGGVVTSATYRDYPGPQITATRQTTNAEILPSLGRNLSNGANGTVNIDLIQPGTLYGKRLRQLDIRISKRLRFAGTRRFAANFDVFNIFNKTGVNTIVTTYGPSWQRPSQLQPARYIKLSAQFDF